MSLKVKVCSKCGHILMASDMVGNPACPICDGKDFQDVDLPERLECIYCKKEKSIEEILKIWKNPPFYQHGTGTYYCGCRGWD